jgi:hypothetical protein
MTAHELNKGMVIDVIVGDSVALHPSIDVRKIVLTVEAKSGQRSRIRIQSNDELKIDPPKKAAAG